MTNATSCAVTGCTNPLKRAGFCYGHYMKNWRYGTPTPMFAPTNAGLQGQRFGSLVVIGRKASKWVCRCDCGETVHTGTTALRQRGQVSCMACAALRRRRDDAGYGAAHDRVRRERGSAAEHQCVDCHESAYHWSYDHEDPDELLGMVCGKYLVAYSLKPEHYSPRCVSCHKRFDLDRRDSASAVVR